jgi:GT2 family glycosyltransferase
MLRDGAGLGTEGLSGPPPVLTEGPERISPLDLPGRALWADSQHRLFLAQSTLGAILDEKVRENEQLARHLAEVTGTRAWRMACLLLRFRKRLAPDGTFRHWLLGSVWRGLRVVLRGRPAGTSCTEVPPRMQHLDADQVARVLALAPRQPLVSVVAPVSHLAPEGLDRCVASVRAQHYPRWKLILVADGSRDPALTRRMQHWTAVDPRIRVLTREENDGIPAATNAGIAAAAGDLVGFLDGDDELTPDALTWVVAMHNRHPGAVWFYSDEDRVDVRGSHHDTFHKPDFSPEYLLASPFTGHFSVYSRELLRRIGGLRPEFDGAHDHDLALRLSEVVSPDQVVHIPRVLYHEHGTEPAVPAVGRRAVASALARRGVRAQVSSDERLPTLYRLEFAPTATPHVTIIVPTRNALGDLRTCIESIHARTRYPHYEVVVIDNRSDDPALFRYLGCQERRGRLRVHRHDRPFNHSAMHNEVVRTLSSELVVFLNNDTEILSDGWLEQMVGTTELDPSVAGVGALLLYPDRTIQHAGVILGLNGLVGHSHKYLPADGPGYFGRPHALQEYTGCTAAMLLIRRRAFLAVGGFDADRYPASFNDVDLWLRLRRLGYRCLYNPAVRAIHYESRTRSIRTEEEQEYQRRLVEDWGPQLLADPFYNPNLSLLNEQFRGTTPYPVQLDFPVALGRYTYHVPAA